MITVKLADIPASTIRKFLKSNYSGVFISSSIVNKQFLVFKPHPYSLPSKLNPPKC